MGDAADILLCRCRYADVADPARVARFEAALTRAGRRVRAVDDLCELVARGDARLAELTDGVAAIVACRARAVGALLASAGVDARDAELIDLRAVPADEALKTLGVQAGDVPDAPVPVPAEPPDGWLAWFPVIDRDRCTDCGQCLNFCLFGVYAARDGGGVRVANPTNCKTYCPACARICPAGAIVFPKHPGSPIDGGETDPDQPNATGDPSEMLAGDVYETLRRRSVEPAAGPDLQRGLEERKACACQAGGFLENLAFTPEQIAEMSEQATRAAADRDRQGDPEDHDRAS